MDTFACVTAASTFLIFMTLRWYLPDIRDLLKDIRYLLKNPNSSTEICGVEFGIAELPCPLPKGHEGRHRHIL